MIPYLLQPLQPTFAMDEAFIRGFYNKYLGNAIQLSWLCITIFELD